MSKTVNTTSIKKTSATLAKAATAATSKFNFTISNEVDSISIEKTSIMKKMIDVVCFLETVEDVDGQLIISRKRAKHMRTWEKILKAEDEDVIIEGRILKKTKGGFVVDIDGIESFLPSMLLSSTENYVKGNVVKLRILHSEPLQNTLILGSASMPKAEVKLNASMLNMREIISLHIGQAG